MMEQHTKEENKSLVGTLVLSLVEPVTCLEVSEAYQEW